MVIDGISGLCCNRSISDGFYNKQIPQDTGDGKIVLRKSELDKKVIADFIRKQKVSFVCSVDDTGFPNVKAMLMPRKIDIFYKKGVTDPDYCVLKFTAVKGRYYCNLKTESFEV